MLRFGCGIQDDPTTSKCNTTKLTIEVAREKFNSDPLIVISIGAGNPQSIKRPFGLREIAEMCLKIVDRNELSAQIAHEKYPRAKNAMDLAKWAAKISPAVLSNDTYFAAAVIIFVFHVMSVMVHAMSPEKTGLGNIIDNTKFLKTDMASIVLLAEEVLNVEFQSNGNGSESLASAYPYLSSALADTRHTSDAPRTFTEALRALIKAPNASDRIKDVFQAFIKDDTFTASHISLVSLVKKVTQDANAASLDADQSLSGNLVDALKKESPSHNSKNDNDYGFLVREAAYLGFRVAKVNEKLPEVIDIIRGAVQAANPGGVGDPSDTISTYQHVSRAMEAIAVVSSSTPTSAKQITDISGKILPTAFVITNGVAWVDLVAEAIVTVFGMYRKDFISFATKLASGAISEVSNAAPIQIHRFSPDIKQVSLSKDGSEIDAADIKKGVQDYMQKEDTVTRITLLKELKRLPVKYH